MLWSTKYLYLPEYEFTGTNQHGARYKKIDSKQVSIATLEADYNNANDLKTLVLLSHSLNVPVHYNFESSKAWIEIISREAIGI